MRLVNRRAIFLTSKDRRVGEKNSFVIELQPDLVESLADPNSYLKVWVPQLVVRYDFDSVTPANNSFRKNGTLIQLTPGNPNIYGVLSELKSHGIEAVYTDGSNRLQFVTSAPYTLDFDVPNSAADLLGFNSQPYTITNGTLSPELVKLGVHDVIYLATSMATNNLELDEDQRTTISRKMVPIPVISKPFSNIVYTDPQGAYSLLLRGVRNVAQLEMSLTDASGVPLDLRRDWYLTVMMELYEEVGVESLQALRTLEALTKSQIDLAKLQLVGSTAKPKVKAPKKGKRK